VVRLAVKLSKTVFVFSFLILFIGMFSGCTKNILAGKNSKIDTGHLIAAPASFLLTSVVPDDEKVTIRFPVAANTANYVASYKLASSNVWTSLAASTTSPIVVTGLTDGLVYDFKVTASNIAGSAVSNILQATPNTFPDPFILTSAVAGDQEAILNWTQTTGVGPINYIIRYGTESGTYSTTVTSSAVSPFTVTGLTNGVTYYFRVFAANYIGETQSVNELSVVPTALPNVPMGLSFAGSIGTTCSLSWTASVGIPPIVYSVFQAFAPTSAATSGTPIGNCTLMTPTACVVSGLVAGVSYNFSVNAGNGSGTSLNSADIACHPVQNSFSLTSAAATSSTAVDVVYPSVTGATTYTTKYSLIAGAASTGAVGCSAIAGTTCSITGLNPNTTYYFITTASSASSSVTASAEMAVTTPSVPTLPLSFTSVGSTGTTCLLNWLASGGTPLITYTVKRSTTPGMSDSAGTPVTGCTAISGVTTCADTSMVAGSTYYYSMRATNAGGSSAATSEVSCTAIQNPFSITSVVQSNSRLTVTWPTVTGATAYTVRYGFSSGSYSLISSTNATIPYQINGLANGTPYYIMVTATNSSSTQNAVAEAVGIPFNSAPVALPITPASFNEDTNSTITLSYTDVENNNPSSCALSSMINVTLVTPCACTGPLCTVTVKGTSDYYGAASFNYTLTDIGGVSNSTTATLNILPANDAPVVSPILAQTTNEDTPIVLSFNLSDIDSIVTCSSLNVVGTSSNTSLVSNAAIVIGGTAPNCTVNITPSANQNGTTNITLTASDNGIPNLQDAKTFTLTVSAVNDAPTIGTISNQTINEDTASAAIPFTIADIDNTLTCSGRVTATSGTTAIIANGGLVIGGTAPNCTITINPVLNQNGGPVVITLAVTDGIIASPITTTFNVTVTPVNDAPTISSISNQTINEDTPTGSLAFTINDIDSALSCTTGVTKTSSNTTIIPNANIVVTGTAPNCSVVVTPAANKNGGPVTITLAITDGISTTNTTFTVTVISILDITSITLPANGVYVQNQDLDFIVNFEANVNVTGTPKLALTVGSAARTANYISGSGTSALLFRYTPTNISATDDYDGDGITFSSTSLVMTGATIVDSTSLLAATVTFTPGVTTGILVDARTYSYSIAFSANHVNENVGSVTATLTMTQAPLIALTFPIQISGTATVGSDYTTTLGAAMVVAAGSTTATATINVIDDAVLENSESLIINVDEPSNRSQYLGAITVATLTINANDAANYPTQIGQTGFSTCAINQLNKLFCTGANDFGLLGVGNLNYRTAFTAVDAASDYSVVGTGSAGSYSYSNCAITTSGILKCWGYNTYGGVGDGTTTHRNSPVIIDSGVSYSKVSNGYHGACGITTSGVLKCWGYNNYYQVGDGTTTNRTSPVVVDAGTTYSQVVRGIYNTCAITTGGILKCWGYNAFGTVGDGTTTDATSPTVIDSGTTYAALTNSLTHTTCAITTSGVLKCWGQGTNGQIGNGASSNRLGPTIVNSGVSFSTVSNSQNAACAITTTGILKCWGLDRNFNIGLAVNTSYSSPQIIHSGESFSQVIVSDSRMCALNSLNVMKCSGQRLMGQMGDGLISQFHSFTSVPALDAYSTLSLSGQYMTAGISSAGTLWSWGYGKSATDLPGDASAQEMIINPVQVAVGSTFTKVSKGNRHTCAIRADQKLYCWGYNTYGNIGDGTLVNKQIPVAVDAANNYIQIAAGNFFTCGILSTGVLKCWGDNSNNSLGDNSTTQRTTPVVIDAGTTYKFLAQPENYTMCAITTTDVLKCWGYNNYGQVGIGGTTNTATPTVVDAGTSYGSVVASIGHTCGVTLGNVLKCWGQNSSSQLGDGTTTDRQLPVVFNSGTSYSAVGLNGLGLTCGITLAGALKCAGARSAGLANSSTEDGFGQSSGVTTVDVGTTYTALYSGYSTICGRTNTGATRCAGDNVYGAFLGSTTALFTTGLQFGTGTASNTLTPIGALP
jgi:alpha-tubulin suppressor-like RCC1 family protein